MDSMRLSASNRLLGVVLLGIRLSGLWASAGDAPNPFSKNEAHDQRDDEFEGIDGPKYRKTLLKTKTTDTVFEPNREQYQQCESNINKSSNPINPKKPDDWCRIYSEYFNTIVVKEVKKTKLPINPQTLICVQVLGADKINELVKKMGENWYQGVPKNVQDFIKQYSGTRKYD